MAAGRLMYSFPYYDPIKLLFPNINEPVKPLRTNKTSKTSVTNKNICEPIKPVKSYYISHKWLLVA